MTIPSFLASYHGSLRLIEDLLPQDYHLDPDGSVQEGVQKWSGLVDTDLPELNNRSFQSSWYTPIASHWQILLQSAVVPEEKARLLAASSPEAGAWLNAIPSPPLGLHMSNETFRIAVALRLGADVCEPHRCPACGDHVNQRGLHGFSCMKSAGTHTRHSTVNDIILRALTTAGIPSIREPSG